MTKMEQCKYIYKDACKLLLISEEHPKEPYKFNYAAKELFEEVKIILYAMLDNEKDIRGQLSATYTNIASIDFNTEELSAAQKNYEKAIEICDNVKISPSTIYCAILSRNSLAVIWTMRDEQEKALVYLEKSESLYLEYKIEHNLQSPKTFDDLFDIADDDNVGWIQLEKLHTHTLFYIAQILEKLDRLSDAAEYCMSTLQRQLASNDINSITWSLNAAKLAQFHQSQCQFRITRRLLAASWSMVQSINEEEFCKTTESKEDYDKCIGVVSKAWGSYCVSLLQESYESLEKYEIEDSSTEPEKGQMECEEEYLNKITFPKLEYSLHEDAIICTKVKTVTEATNVFKFGLRQLNDSWKYFTLLEHATTHTDIARKISTLYKLLAEFDPTTDRQSKMHKRRIVLLSDIVVELNPQYYLNVCRQLHYEIGEAYSAILDCKYQILGSDQPTMEQLDKINSIVLHATQAFDKVLDSFNSDENGIKIFSEGYERAALSAYVRQGRLWTKFYCLNKRECVDSTQKAVECYKKALSYCDAHPNSVESVKEELDVSRSMVALLPLKVDRFLNEDLSLKQFNYCIPSCVQISKTGSVPSGDN